MAYQKGSLFIHNILFFNFNRYDFTIFYEYALYSKEKSEFPDTYNDYLEMNKVFSLVFFNEIFFFFLRKK